MTHRDNIAHLKELRFKLNAQKMSVLIGAGFSINASDKFLSWNDLLYDLTLELYKDELELKFEDYINKKIKVKKGGKESFYTEQVNKIINRVGYLNIVSQYIQWKGYREVITNYIEDRTPQVIKKGNSVQIIFNQNGVRINQELSKEDLALHKNLTQLPWNNIYTTNYDTLLESVIDIDIETKLTKLIKEIDEKLTSEIENKQALEKAETRRLNKSENPSSEASLQDLNLENNLSNPYVGPFFDIALDTNDSKRREYEANKKEFDRRIKKYGEELESLKKELDNCLKVVTNSSDLGIKRNKNIIKLHGTLRTENEKEEGVFCFDDDIHKHYVIAKEDYESYPVKHEAFTQLMRISLLQESYCIIGFSGTDPNFMAWIGWVRDILEKRQINGNHKKEYKIYLIDVGSDQITKDKLLFFENHRIIRITLGKPEIITFLENETKQAIQNTTSKKSLIRLFLNYLADSSTPLASISLVEKMNLEEYDRIWEVVRFPHKIIEITKETFQNVGANVEQIKALKKTIRIPSVDFSSIGSKKDLISWFVSLLEKSKSIDDGIHTKGLLELLVIALQDCLYPLNMVFYEEDDVKKIETELEVYEDLMAKYQTIVLRTYLLKNTKEEFGQLVNKIEKTGLVNKDQLIYEQLVFLAFNFDFINLKEQLEIWKPCSFWITKKAGLIALFDTEKAENLLKNYVIEFEDETSQEQLYALEMFAYVKQSNSWVYDKELRHKIKAYTNSGLHSLDNNFKYLVRELNKEDKKVGRYGDDKYISFGGMHFSWTSNKKQSAQFLQLLIETGFPLSIENVNYQNKEDWYQVSKAIFEFYPYPILFYSLQYSNENLLERIGQDYAYSESLKNELARICETLFNAWLNDVVPLSYRKSILYFCSELFIVLEPEVWEILFYQIWTSLKAKNRVFNHKHLAEVSFIKPALKYIKNKDIIMKIISDILSNLNDYSRVASDYLYYLANNPHLSKYKLKPNSPLYGQIKKMVLSIPQGNKDVLFALGNLNEIVPNSLRKEIGDVLIVTDLTKLDSSAIWRVLLYYARNNSVLKNKVKQGVINSQFLWHSGINESGGVSIKDTCILLHLLTKKPKRKNGLVWSDDEVTEIYSRLLGELEKIKGVLLKLNDYNSFKWVLEEMIYFLEAEKKRLMVVENYQSIYAECKRIYLEQKGYNNLFEGLTSDDKNQVNWALAELNKFLYYDNFNENKAYLSLLLDKILLRSNTALETTLGYIAFWFYDLRKKKSLREFNNTIENILIKYDTIDLSGLEIPLIKEHLIKLAIVLDYWNVKTEIVKKWLIKKENSRFNNIKNMKLD